MIRSGLALVVVAAVLGLLVMLFVGENRLWVFPVGMMIPG